MIFGGHNNDGPKSDPLWWEDAPPPVIPRQVLPARKVDVAVVGAGYTGLAAAIELARAGRSVVVLDAGDPGHGASTRNGGLLFVPASCRGLLPSICLPTVCLTM